MIEDLAFDFHAWFKHAPCKEEDFRALGDVEIQGNQTEK